MVTWQYRDSIGASADLIPLFRRVLEHCKLRPDERMMVYCDHHSPPHFAAAFVTAAREIGAEAFQVVIPTNQPDISEGPIWNLWHSVDMVVDLESIMTSVYRLMRVSALEHGVRVLRVTEPEDVLFRLAPDPTVRDRVRRAEARLQGASELHVTSPAGTNMVVNVAGRNAYGLWGAPDRPGKWDHWSVGVVVGGANHAGTNGALVIDVGDILLAMQRYVTTPIRIEVEEGIITRIEGGLDAHLLRQWFAQWNDPRAYYVSHVGWGCDHRADWNRMAAKAPGGVGDVESVSGVFQIAFGRDTSWYIGGGVNDVVAHIDFNCLAHSISLDGQPVTLQGIFVDEALIAAN